nr:MAG TPA: hypothetical protein [Crassvirales sp.]
MILSLMKYRWDLKIKCLLMMNKFNSSLRLEHLIQITIYHSQTNSCILRTR